MYIIRQLFLVLDYSWGLDIGTHPLFLFQLSLSIYSLYNITGVQFRCQFEIRSFNLRAEIVRANEKRIKKFKIPFYVVHIISNLL